jgi:PAS domain S-box-containing protein
MYRGLELRALADQQFSGSATSLRVKSSKALWQEVTTMSPKRPEAPLQFPEPEKNDGIRSLSRESKSNFPSSRGDYMTIIDMERRYVQVSDGFCKLVGYERKALLGMRYDQLTAPETNDVFTTFNLFCQLEYMQGLWMLVARSGTQILVRYEAWLRSDNLIEAHMQLVGAGS